MKNPFPPQCAERFRAERVIASGGFGTVIEATQLGLNRRVAIKLLDAHVLADEEQVRRFRNEARVTATITHPNVIVVIDHDVEDGIPWIAYEFLPGRTLHEILESGPLTLHAAFDAVIQIAGALSAAHELGVLHRDIKPANVIEVMAGNYKVADFGIARWANSDGVRTKTGLLFGTPAYIAPEQIRGEEASALSDLYALGVVFFELLTGQKPFRAPALEAILDAHLTNPPPAPSSLRADVPRSVDRLVLKSLAKLPAERPQSAQSFVEELTRCRESLPAGLLDAAFRPAPGRRVTGKKALPDSGAPRIAPPTVAAPVERAHPDRAATPRATRARSFATFAVALILCGGAAGVMRQRPVEPMTDVRQPASSARVEGERPPASVPTRDALHVGADLRGAIERLSPHGQIAQIRQELAQIPTSKWLRSPPSAEMSQLAARWADRLGERVSKTHLPELLQEFEPYAVAADWGAKPPAAGQLEVLLALHELLDLEYYTARFSIPSRLSIPGRLETCLVPLEREPTPGLEGFYLRFKPLDAAGPGSGGRIPEPAGYRRVDVPAEERFHPNYDATTDDVLGSVTSSRGQALVYRHADIIDLGARGRPDRVELFGVTRGLNRNSRFDVALEPEGAPPRTIAVIRGDAPSRRFRIPIDPAVTGLGRVRLRVELKLLPDMTGLTESGYMQYLGLAWGRGPGHG